MDGLPGGPSLKRDIIRGLFLVDMSPVVRLLIISDVILIGAMQLLAPIFALFIIDRIPGANAAVVGASATVYLIAKSVAQIPAAALLDRIKGERDDYLALVASSVVGGLVPLLYLLVTTPLELYLVQFLLGLTAAFAYPSYVAIFTRHIDREREATEWGVRFTLTDLSAAVGASLGGLVAVTAGFAAVIYGFVALNVLGTLALIPVRRAVRKR